MERRGVSSVGGTDMEGFKTAGNVKGGEKLVYC